MTEKALHRLARRLGAEESGVALLVVILTVTLLLTVAMRFTYETHVDYQLANNSVDEAQAYYLARSGLAIYKLILTADQQVTGNPQLKAMAEGAGVNLGAFGLWQLVPEIDTRLIRAFGIEDVPEEEKEALREQMGGSVVDFMTGAKKFLDFDGDFRVTIEDEASKINLNFLNKTRISKSIVDDSPVGRALMGMMLDAKYNYLFEGQNALGEPRLSRDEVLANIYDWIDSDTNQILYGGGFEDQYYYGYDDDYKTRNASFETLDELNMVRGIDDDFIEAFSSQLTIYPFSQGDGLININTASADVVLSILMAYSETGLTPEAAKEAVDKILEFRALSPFSKAQDFVSFVQDQLGIPLTGGSNVAPTAPPGAATGPTPTPTPPGKGGKTPVPGAKPGATANGILAVIGTESKVFRLRSTGYSGRASVTITAVVDNTNPSSLNYLYWRVE